ncbi:MAG: Do family serine endopeptidase [Polyangiaceae bacterium]|nr:Do family serine endopeptidase [Polyangiaceae bacterium]
MRKTRWAAAWILSSALATWGCAARQGVPPASSSAPAQQQTAPALPSFPPLAQPAAAEPELDGQKVGVPDVVQRVVPSVVSISSTRTRTAQMPDFPIPDPFFRFFFGPDGNQPEQREEQGLGSGVIVGSGLVLTSNHVVEGADDITVTTNDRRDFKAKVAGTDPKSDLALLRIDGDTSMLRPITWGSSSQLRLGEYVLAIGNPFGVGQTVTMGIVSAVGRADLGIVDYEDFIQTDAAINPGNSGGALVNLRGELVGINTAILSRSGGNMGIGFAIPTDMARPIMQSLLERGKVVRGWLGVGIQSIDQDLAQALKLRETTGVLVTEVTQGTPADKAGLRRSDVILSLDGKPVNSTGELRNLVAAAGAAKKVVLGVARDGKELKVAVVLGEMPAQLRGSTDGGVPDATEAPLDVAGADLEALTPEARKHFRIPDRVDHGVVVRGVKPGGAASKAGLMRGDVILEVDRKRIDSVDAFRSAWRGAQGRILLVVSRRGRTVYLVARP